jgi:hypothetical protein
MNINRACFHMLDDYVPIQFKVSNVPTLTGWNASMSIQEILTQLETAYGKPTPMALHNNNLLFRSPMATNDVPKLLFHRIEQCQEIATLAGDPHTQMHHQHSRTHLNAGAGAAIERIRHMGANPQ